MMRQVRLLIVLHLYINYWSLEYISILRFFFFLDSDMDLGTVPQLNCHRLCVWLQVRVGLR